MGPNPNNSFNIPAQPEAPRSDAENMAVVADAAAGIVAVRASVLHANGASH